MESCEYTFLGQIGEGTYAKVYRVRTSSGTLLAVKDIVSQTLHGVPDINEIDIMSRIKHPNLMTVDCLVLPGETDCPLRGVGIVQPLATGSLLKLIQDVKLNLDQKVAIMYQLALGLSALHSNGILHLDIKLENALYQGDPYHPLVKLSDFGLSRYVSNLSTGVETSRVLVTLSYRPPELLDRHQIGWYRYTAMTDIWSLGILFLEILLNGAAIFPIYWSTSDVDVPLLLSYERSLFSTPDYLQAVVEDKDALSLLIRMLDINPERRPTVQEVLRNDLFRRRGLSRQPDTIVVQPSPILAYNVDDLVKSVALLLISSLYQYHSNQTVETLFLTMDLFYRAAQLAPPRTHDHNTDRLTLWNIALTSFLIANKLIVDDITITDLLVEETVITSDIIEETERVIIRSFDGILYRPYLYTRCPNLKTLEEAFPYLVEPTLYLNMDISEWLRLRSDLRPDDKHMLIRQYIPRVARPSF